MGLQRIYKPGFELTKAGVMLLDLAPDTQLQSELIFGEPCTDSPSDGRERLMSAMDLLNERFGRSTVHVASTGLDHRTRQWAMKQERRTPAYTTRWEEVAVVRA
jgi:DNA polymerase V